jgi:hypothetical protein
MEGALSEAAESSVVVSDGGDGGRGRHGAFGELNAVWGLWKVAMVVSRSSKVERELIF